MARRSAYFIQFTSVVTMQGSKVTVKIQQYLLMNVIAEHGVTFQSVVAGYYYVDKRDNSETNSVTGVGLKRQKGRQSLPKGTN